MSLFIGIDQFKKYIAVDAQTSIDTLTPYIEEAQVQFLEDLLGETFLTSLLADYDGGTPGEVTGDNIALLPFVQRPLANYTLYLASDILAVNVGDAGITESRGDNSDPAPKWKVDNLKLNYIRQGDIHAEKLLAFLEKNSSPTKYNDWYSSSTNTIADGLIVPTATVASQYVDINESRRIFKRLKRYIKEIETGLIKRLIGQAQYDEIVTQIKSDTLSTANETLIAYLRPIVSKKALYQAIPTLRLSITENGITVFSSNDGIVSKSAAARDDIKWLMHSLKSDESGYEGDIEDLKQFIIDSIATYPLIEASTAYTSRPDPGPKRPPINESGTKHFSV